MTRDDIIRMAREAGDGVFSNAVVFSHKELERFAELVAAAEREACARVCDQMHIGISHANKGWHHAIASCANSIRARGKQK